MNLQNINAIVSGGSGDLGSELAKQLAAEGCRVAITYNSSKEKANKVAAQCLDLGKEAMSVQGDITKNADCLDIAKKVHQKWGKIHLLINNAAITNFAPYSDLDALTPDDFQEVFNVNVIGVYLMSRAVSAYMDGGMIINISSTASLNGSGISLAYTASKGALNSLTLGLARALRHKNILVNAICPSYISSNLWKKRMTPNRQKTFEAAQKEATITRQINTPASVAKTIIKYIQAFDNVTGELLRIDGGLHLSNLVNYIDKLNNKENK